MATKSQFVDSFIAACVARYPWAKDPVKLANARKAAEETVNGGNAMSRTGPAFYDACAAVGILPDATLKALHALPVSEAK